ncbi:MAG: Gfo/Idh/MocA family oxidoreductase [Lentisphaerae bacterium]|nr:Gfo/Idh/MocA family oxidoreductase [Lentisphaerota bacterium]
MKIAVIGNRGHLNYLFEDLPKLPDCQLAAAAATGSERPDWTIKEAAAMNHAPLPVFDNYQQMLDTVKPDIAVVSGPFEDRCAMCCYALERNIAVFAEKPVAITLQELAALEQCIKQHNGVLYGMMGIRFEAPFYTALKLINSGAIGAVKLIYTRKSYKIGNRPEYFFHRQTYGGTIPWVGIHAVDWIARCNAGSFQSVRAIQHIGEKGRGTLETAAHCIFSLSGGAIASADIDYMRPAGAATHGDDRLRAVGEKGVIEVAKGQVELITTEGTTTPELEAPPLGCFGQMVVDLQNNSPALQAETQQTLQVTRAALTAQLSADKNCELTI